VLAGRLALQDALAHILVELFIGDVVSLVWKGFGGGIAAQCQHEDPKVAYLGEKKMQAYSKWSELPHPLAMDAELATLDIEAGRRQKTKKYSSWELLTIISGKEASFSHVHSTTQEMGESLVDLANAVRHRWAKAPLVHGGLLHHALPAAQERLARRAQTFISKEDMEKALGTALGRALKAQKVEFVPYHKAAEGQSHPSAADPRWWMRIRRSSYVGREPSEEFSASKEEVLGETAPWKLPTKPQHLRRIIHQTELPIEWSLEHASLGGHGSRDPVIINTYKWAELNYDGNKPLHRMALLWSIMFSWVLPQVGIPAGTDVGKANTAMEATSAILNIPWETVKRKGTKAALPYIVMVTCYIISFFEPGSPLQMHLEENSNMLGDDWTKKHGKFSNKVLLRHIRLSRSFFLWIQEQSASMQ